MSASARAYIRALALMAALLCSAAVSPAWADYRGLAFEPVDETPPESTTPPVPAPDVDRESMDEAGTLSPSMEQPGEVANAPAEEDEGFSGILWTSASGQHEIELDLDAYYTSLGLYLSLTNTPIPDLGEVSEFVLYRDLFFSSYIPRFAVLEASVYPMSVLGAGLRSHSHAIYENFQISPSFNIVRAITAGFDEPYALSLFLGNVVKFTGPDQREMAGNKGFMGYLVSVGDYHVKDNSLIPDNWIEFEWKVKGDRETPSSKLSWSFRIGTKIHEHPEITDVMYFAIRRSRLEYDASPWNILRNSAFEYIYDVTQDTFDPVQHKFFIEKKIPIQSWKKALSLAVGAIWTSGRKYSGALRAEEDTVEGWQFIIRPNVQF
jgi:hypothetical protein